MRIGLIDVDADFRKKVTYPNLALMKISAFHKSIGDRVEWHKIGEHYNVVYISKVFSDEYTKEVLPFISADKIIRGGSGYAIKEENGLEVYHKELDRPLPENIEHIFPDYSIYGLTEDAHGFLTRGCPRNCKFCHVAGMQGLRSHTVARLSEFWNGQKTVHLYDPNILACNEWSMHFEDLAMGGCYVDFNQGLDVRLLTKEKCEALNSVKYKMIHFAWDKPEEDLRGQLEFAKQNLKKCSKSNTMVYILANFNSTMQQNIDRVEFVKSLKMQPYLMCYMGANIPQELKRLKRYANNPYVCWATPTFANYDSSKRSERFGKTGMKHKKPNERKDTEEQWSEVKTCWKNIQTDDYVV